MTEEIIKECKNCEALGIDSEIGVYYCCLSHRQDDLPKEFICDDYTPNKQLKRLEQENNSLQAQLNNITVQSNNTITALKQENRELKAYKDVNEDFKKAWDELNEKYTEVLKLAKENADSNEYCLQELEQNYEQLRSALEEIKTIADKFDYWNNNLPKASEIIGQIKDKINEVINF